MKLLDIQKNKVVISAEALTIKEFKDIWDSDTSKDKVSATEDLSYVVFMTDRKSPYINYTPDLKESKVISDVIKRKNWKSSPEVKAACKKYKELHTTASSGLLEDAENGLYKFREYLRNTADQIPDDEEGKIATRYLDNIEKIDKLLKTIDSLRERVDKEQQDSMRVWGGGKLGNREMPRKG